MYLCNRPLNIGNQEGSSNSAATEKQSLKQKANAGETDIFVPPKKVAFFTIVPT